MSANTNPTPINPREPLSPIVAARSVIDVATAMRNDPDLANAILGAAGQIAAGGGKALLISKSFWAALLTPAVSFAVTYWGLHLDAASVGTVTTILTTAAMILARVITKEPITGIVSPAPQGTFQ